MEKKFEVGQRVAADWYNPQTHKYERVRGVYRGISEADKTSALVKIKDESGSYCCAPNSIKRLVPRKRREFVGTVDSAGVFLGYPSLDEAQRQEGLSVKFTTVREIPAKKGAKK